MPTPQEVVAVMEAVRSQILQLPGVLAIGVGPKISNGIPTGELAILVMVTKKLPEASIPVAERIPPEIQGVKTDVSIGTRTGPMQDLLKEDERRFRDLGLQGGIQLMRGDGARGTLGCIATQVIPEGNFIVALTNAHVVNAVNLRDQTVPFKEQLERTGAEIGQPTIGDSDCSGCCSDVVGTVLAAQYTTEIDAALILLQPKLKWSADIEEMGPMAGTRDIDDLTSADLLSMNIIVKKRGRTTLTTRGVVRSSMLNTSSSKPHPDFPEDPTKSIVLGQFNNQLHILPTPPFRYYVDSGDSGSVSVDVDRQMVGLNWGGGEMKDSSLADKVVYADGVASHIQRLQDNLNLEIATATTQGETHVVPDTNTVPGDARAGAAAVPRMGAPARSELGLVTERLKQSPAGSQYLGLVERHRDEVRRLITSQVRVAAVWRRHRGAWLGSRILSAVYAPEQPVFEGRDPLQVTAAIETILGSLQRYGSPRLREDLALVRPLVARWSPLSMAAILRELMRAEDLDMLCRNSAQAVYLKARAHG